MLETSGDAACVGGATFFLRWARDRSRSLDALLFLDNSWSFFNHLENAKPAMIQPTIKTIQSTAMTPAGSIFD